MKKIIRFMQRENLFNLLLAILTIVLVSGVLISFFEEGISLGGGVWWHLTGYNRRQDSCRHHYVFRYWTPGNAQCDPGSPADQ